MRFFVFMVKFSVWIFRCVGRGYCFCVCLFLCGFSCVFVVFCIWFLKVIWRVRILEVFFFFVLCLVIFFWCVFVVIRVR